MYNNNNNIINTSKIQCIFLKLIDTNLKQTTHEKRKQYKESSLLTSYSKM